MVQVRFFLFIPILFFLFAWKHSVGQDSVPRFIVSEKTTHPIPKDQEYTFGYLEVPENRKTSTQKTIRIPVYIFKSRNPHPQKDPIIYTVGGPGSTTMPSAQYMNYYRYLDDRDFILVEQRGNYYAQPHLDCPEWAEASYQANLPGVLPKQADSLLAKAAKSCHDRLLKKGIDLNGYQTTEIAADIADLVKVLGIKSYNLLTISYSTKIAQVLLRDYPEGIRSVVMDSPLPLEVNYDEESVANLLAALNHFLADCAQDADCNQAFPDLQSRFLAYLTEKTKDPLVVEVKNPKSGKKETFYLKGKDLITIFSSASTGDMVNLPYEIDQLLNNNVSTIQSQLVDLLEGPGSGAGMGMRLSVWCAEEYPFVSQAVVKSETEKYPETSGLSPAVFESEICDIWGVENVSEIENLPVESEVPVLFISGEYDSDTPAKWAAAMKSHFPNSYQLIFSGWRHTPTTNWSNPCAMEAANAFFNDPNQVPTPECLKKIQQPIFRTE